MDPVDEFADWADAFDACREGDAPMVVRVNGETKKIFPSGAAVPYATKRKSRPALPGKLRKYSAVIETIEDERDNGNGIWVYLRPGWCRDGDGEHAIHEDTISDLAAWLPPIRCQCAECRK